MKKIIVLLVSFFIFSLSYLYPDCPYRIRGVQVRSRVELNDNGVFYYHVNVSNTNPPPPNIVNQFDDWVYKIPKKEGKIPLPPPPVEMAPYSPFLWFPSVEAFQKYCLPVSMVAPVSWHIKEYCIEHNLEDCDRVSQDWSYSGVVASKEDACYLGKSAPYLPLSAPFSLHYYTDINPGEDVDFLFASYGIPKITEFEVDNEEITIYESFYKENGLEGATGDDVYAFMKSQGCSDAELEDRSYTRYIAPVLGPDSLPYPFNITDFVLKIHNNYFNYAVMYGWIKCEIGFTGGFHAPPAFRPMYACPDPEHCHPPGGSDRPCGEMEGYLLDAYQDVKSGDFSSASDKLSSALELLDEKGCENYSNCPTDTVFQSEAYGLLYYNIGFAEDYLEGGGGSPAPPFFKGGKWKKREKIEKDKPVHPPKKLISGEKTEEEASSGVCHGFWCWLEEFIKAILRWMGFLQ